MVASGDVIFQRFLSLAIILALIVIVYLRVTGQRIGDIIHNTTEKTFVGGMKRG